MQKQKIVILGGILLSVGLLAGCGDNKMENISNNNITTQTQVNNSKPTTPANKTTDKIKNGVHLISPAEFKEKVDSGEYVLVDIRTPEEYQAGHIKGAINIDYYAPDFKEQVSKLDKNKKYLYYCRSGHRSGEAEVLAKVFNFPEVYELDGGINVWKEAGYPIKK